MPPLACPCPCHVSTRPTRAPSPTDDPYDLFPPYPCPACNGDLDNPPCPEAIERERILNDVDRVVGYGETD